MGIWAQVRQALRLWCVHMQEKEKIMNTENNTTGRALWRTGLRAMALAFGALGWVLSTLREGDERRQREDGDEPPQYEPMGAYGDNWYRYTKGGDRLF